MFVTSAIISNIRMGLWLSLGINISSISYFRIVICLLLINAKVHWILFSVILDLIALIWFLIFYLSTIQFELSCLSRSFFIFIFESYSYFSIGTNVRPFFAFGFFASSALKNDSTGCSFFYVSKWSNAYIWFSELMVIGY